ncbi:MarC family protein [Actinotignum sp. GS-2025f]|uniref:MarC family protein n=1 Tax=Actinomycetaceae TaxID=2049 RepID=UPI00237E23F5|nr:MULTISPECIES: MarC family protein [Actinotignum]MDE1654647.1 MarC family protein [Actinotignum schaalii]MDY5128152.1 MarC family protein [Actinotignum sp. SLA_B059]
MAVFDVTIFLSTFMTLFVIADPLGNLPVFIALTARNTNKERNRAAWQSVLTSAIVLAIFAVFGKYILDLLGITTAAMQISGGILLLLVALQLMQDESNPQEEEAKASSVNIALVPMGIPLLAGPGAIVAIMIKVEESGDSLGGILAIIAAFILLHIIEWVVLRFASPMHRLLGEGGTVFLTRIAGMLLAAISVQLIIAGAVSVWPGAA